MLIEFKKWMLFSLAFFTSLCYSQSTELSGKKIENQPPLSNPPKETQAADKKLDFLTKKASYAVLFVGDYAKTFSSNVDMNGNHTTDDKASDNGFYLRYVRL